MCGLTTLPGYFSKVSPVILYTQHICNANTRTHTTNKGNNTIPNYQHTRKHARVVFKLPPFLLPLDAVVSGWCGYASKMGGMQPILSCSVAHVRLVLGCDIPIDKKKGKAFHIDICSCLCVILFFFVHKHLELSAVCACCLISSHLNILVILP